MNAAPMPTASDTRAPYSSRTICARPRSSPPNQNAGSASVGLAYPFSRSWRVKRTGKSRGQEVGRHRQHDQQQQHDRRDKRDTVATQSGQGVAPDAARTAVERRRFGDRSAECDCLGLRPSRRYVRLHPRIDHPVRDVAHDVATAA